MHTSALIWEWVNTVDFEKDPQSQSFGLIGGNSHIHERQHSLLIGREVIEPLARRRRRHQDEVSGARLDELR